MLSRIANRLVPKNFMKIENYVADKMILAYGVGMAATFSVMLPICVKNEVNKIIDFKCYPLLPCTIPVACFVASFYSLIWPYTVMDIMNKGLPKN